MKKNIVAWFFESVNLTELEQTAHDACYLFYNTRGLNLFKSFVTQHYYSSPPQKNCTSQILFIVFFWFELRNRQMVV